MDKVMPKELASLIHHIELNKSGWLEKGLKQLIAFIFWLHKNSLTKDDILKYVKEFVPDINHITLNEIIEEMITSKNLLKLETDKLCIPNEDILKLDKNVKNNDAADRKIKEYYFSLQQVHLPSIQNNSWNDFYELFLIPYIKENGANTYNILSERKIDHIGNYLSGFIKKYQNINESSLTKLVLDFFNPTEESVRTFIYSHLNMYFFLLSFQLDKNTIHYLSNVSESKPSFKIFIDTNFLFSILGLHDNPSNESAIQLQKIINQLKHDLDVKLYILPITHDETLMALTSICHNTEGIMITQNIANSILDINATGIYKSIAEKVKKNGKRVKIEDYLKPYIKNLKTILKEKGVNIFNVDLSYLRNDKDIITQIHERQAYFNTNRNPGDDFKQYETVEHDIVIREFIKGKRDRYIDNVLDAT